MEYEGATMAQGGKAVRFDVRNNVCRIDREMMMKGNLDSSTGSAMARIVALGGDDNEFFYWRHAAGNADGASLGSAGSCAARFNFTKVTSSENFLPMATLPQLGIEVPNRRPVHHPTDSHYNAELCQYGVQYNSISDPELCCEACESLKWLLGRRPGHALRGVPDHARTVPDRAREALHRPLRHRWAGPVPASNARADATQATSCVTGNRECERADDSHGYWGTCEQARAQTTNMCEYYSFPYYRDRLAATGEFLRENADATKPSYVSFDGSEPADLAGGMNIKINAIAATVRTDKNLTGAPASDAVGASGHDVARAANNDGYNATNPRARASACTRPTGTEAFTRSRDRRRRRDAANMDPEKATVTKEVVAESALCCPSADGSGCEPSSPSPREVTPLPGVRCRPALSRRRERGQEVCRRLRVRGYRWGRL